MTKTWEILSRMFKQMGKHLGKYGKFLVICLKEHGKYIVKVEGEIRKILRETCFLERKTQS